MNRECQEEVCTTIEKPLSFVYHNLPLTSAADILKVSPACGVKKLLTPGASKASTLARRYRQLCARNYNELSKNTERNIPMA